MNDIKEIRNLVEYKKGQRDMQQQDIENITMEIRKTKQSLTRYERALEIVKQVGLTTQKQLEYHLGEQVCMGMKAVFEDPYGLQVNFQENRGKTEAELLFERRGVCFPPIGSAGGGTIDVASLTLRIAYWTMRQDKKVRPLLLLDEPFSQLKGEEANKRALALLQEISHKLKLQVIMISDERIPREDIISNADKVFQVAINEGKSKVYMIKE